MGKPGSLVAPDLVPIPDPRLINGGPCPVTSLTPNPGPGVRARISSFLAGLLAEALEPREVAAAGVQCPRLSRVRHFA